MNARTRRLRQCNVFTRVCHSVYKWGCIPAFTWAGRGVSQHESGQGVCIQAYTWAGGVWTGVGCGPEPVDVCVRVRIPAHTLPREASGRILLELLKDNQTPIHQFGDSYIMKQIVITKCYKVLGYSLM